jgi:hypothetical protein
VRRVILTSAINPGPSAVLNLQESTLNNRNFSICQLPGACLTPARGDALRQVDVRRILYPEHHRLLCHSAVSRIDVRLQHLRETHLLIAQELVRGVLVLLSAACCPNYWGWVARRVRKKTSASRWLRRLSLRSAVFTSLIGDDATLEPLP